MRSLRHNLDAAILAMAALIVMGASAPAAQAPTPVISPAQTLLQQRLLRTISIEIRDTPIQDVVRLVAEQAGVNHVISPAVTGNITVKLTDVPLGEALENILTTHGFGYSLGENIIRVAPLSELAVVQERMVHEVFHITYAGAEEVAKALEKIRTKAGMVSLSSGTSHIIVTDTEASVKAMRDFIAKVDTVTPQVLVEARIYDLTSKDRLDIGIEWQAGTSTTYSPANLSGLSTVGTNPTGDHWPFTTGAFSAATGKATGTGLIRFGWLSADLDIDAVLKAQQNDIDAKLLANPRVLVLDNEKAVIKIIQEIPYQELTQSSEGGQLGTTAFREVGVELDVTPHVTRDSMVRLVLSPKFSIKTDEVVLVGSGNTAFPQPVVDRREATTTLLVEDGRTVVLGGLRQKNVTRVINKVPLLGDVPGLGMLFRFEGEDTVMSELVVFITPRIVTKPLMTADEQQRYESTNFAGPKEITTRFEKQKQAESEGK